MLNQILQNQTIQGVIEKNYNDVQFVDLMRKVISEAMESNPFYKEIVEKSDFKVDDLNSIDDLGNIPYLPSLFFKESSNYYKKLLKVPEKSVEYWNVSSCTSGDPSLVGVDSTDVEFLFEMARRCFLEFIPRDWDKAYILAFSPSAKLLNRIVMRYTKQRPAKSYSANFYKATEYMAELKYLINFSLLNALKAIILTRSLVGAFVINAKHVFKTFDKNLKKPKNERLHVALGGSNQLLLKFIDMMKEKNIKYDLGANFDVVVGGGGWDGHKAQMKYDPIDKTRFISEIVDAFGTEPKQIVDIYGFTETPIIFGSHWSGKHEDFVMHCPPYARIFVREVKTLDPLRKEGSKGFFECLTPFGNSASVNHAIVIDDLVELISKNTCPECGYKGDTFKILGRVKGSQGLGCSSVMTWL